MELKSVFFWLFLNIGLKVSTLSYALHENHATNLPARDVPLFYSFHLLEQWFDLDLHENNLSWCFSSRYLPEMPLEITFYMF